MKELKQGGELPKDLTLKRELEFYIKFKKYLPGAPKLIYRSIEDGFIFKFDNYLYFDNKRFLQKSYDTYYIEENEYELSYNNENFSFQSLSKNYPDRMKNMKDVFKKLSKLYDWEELGDGLFRIKIIGRCINLNDKNEMKLLKEFTTPLIYKDYVIIFPHAESAYTIDNNKIYMTNIFKISCLKNRKNIKYHHFLKTNSEIINLSDKYTNDELSLYLNEGNYDRSDDIKNIQKDNISELRKIFNVFK